MRTINKIVLTLALSVILSLACGGMIGYSVGTARSSQATTTILDEELLGTAMLMYGTLATITASIHVGRYASALGRSEALLDYCTIEFHSLALNDPKLYQSLTNSLSIVAASQTRFPLPERLVHYNAERRAEARQIFTTTFAEPDSNTVLMAQQGDRTAQIRLGYFFEAAGSPSNAIYWFERAAEQGSDLGKSLISLLHGFGPAEVRDESEALRLFLELVETGRAKAAFSAGLFYEHGRGVERDLISAYTYYRIADEMLLSVSEMGDPDSQIALERLRERLEPDEIAEAEKRLRAWKEGRN